MRFERILQAGVAALALWLAACGGGSGGGAEGGIGGTGIGTASVAFGPISAFGSVWVNGVEYDTEGASIALDGRAVPQADLRIGMVATVDGSIASGKATAVTVRSAIRGPVELVTDANRMTVMGQLVQTDEQTVFEGGVRPVAGDLVEVHGQPVDQGVLAAGYVARKTAPADPPFKVLGFAQAHDVAGQTFRVGALQVRYDAAERGDMPAGVWDGLLVEVLGTACLDQPVCTSLTASRVEPGGLRVRSRAEAEIEGFVTAADATGFVIGAQPVQVSPATVYDGGVATDVALGLRLEVEGSLAGGVLMATKVSFRDGVRAEGNVATRVGNELTISALPGLTVEVNALTRLKDLSSLNALVAPNHVRVRGRVIGSDRLIATEIERSSTSAETEVRLRGPVTAFASPSLTILGVAIDTGAVDNGEFKGPSGSTLGRAGFFSALRSGATVQAEGEWQAGTLRWLEMQLED